MFKRDAIFWIASGIFLLSLCLAATTQNQLWLFLMIASYLLRPTLASLGVARRSIDERQMSIQYRSGNIAFAVMMVASVGLALWLNAKNDPAWEMFNIVILLGLATKGLFNVLLVRNYRTVGSRIIMAVGMLVLLFVGAENGLSPMGLLESAPWLLVVVLGWFAPKYPKAVATLIFVATAGLLFFILNKGLTPGQIATALLVCVPLAVAGTCLIIPEPAEAETDPPATDAARS